MKVMKSSQSVTYTILQGTKRLSNENTSQIGGPALLFSRRKNVSFPHVATGFLGIHPMASFLATPTAFELGRLPRHPPFALRLCTAIEAISQAQLCTLTSTPRAARGPSCQSPPVGWVGFWMSAKSVCPWPRPFDVAQPEP